MKRLLVFVATLALTLTLSASVATADTCACGGYLFSKAYHYPDEISAGHWDCLWYWGNGQFTFDHGC